MKPLLTVLTASLLLGASLSQADNRKESILEDRLQLRLGVFWPQLDSSFSKEGKLRPGDTLDLERHLDLDEGKSSAYGGLAWRFATKHSLDFEYFDLGRNGRVDGERDWDIGDVTVSGRARIDTTFDVKIARLSYQYSLYKWPGHKIGFLAGIHHATLEAEMLMSGDLMVNGEPVFVSPETPIAELSKTEAPLPHFGINYAYAYSPDWSLHASLIGFGMSIDEYSGLLIEANASVMYQFHRRFGVGAGFKYFDLNVDREKRDTTSEYEFKYFGPALFLTATF